MNQNKITIYTTNYCPYCIKAKELFKQKMVDFEEIDLTNDDDGRLELVKMAGGKKTVPQIFINDKHIGGCDDLYALEKDGKLDTLIK